MSIDLIFKGIATTLSTTNTINNLIKISKGTQRGLMIELKKNILILDSFVKDDLSPIKTVQQLEDKIFNKVIESNYNFNKIQGKKIIKKIIADIPKLKKYIGWSTEKLFINIYLKIDNLKKIINIGFDENKINMNIRVTNIFILMLLLVKHINK
jgi:hypothetical protein